MDDASAQNGSITVDGLRLDHFGNNSQVHPIVHMTDNRLSEVAECHFRNVQVSDNDPRRVIFNRGGSSRVDPFVKGGVPYYIHDYYGPGRHAKIVSTRAPELMQDGLKYHEEPPLTGDESRVAEVSNVNWPTLLEPTDDLPPATIITKVTRDGSQLLVRGVSHDNGEITAVTINNQAAKVIRTRSGVVDWELKLAAPNDGQLVAFARDSTGNVEQTVHRLEASLRE
jgi:hypothetical protein